MESISVQSKFRLTVQGEIEDPVSQEIMTQAVTIVPCGHTFNEDTVAQCLARNQLCPLDRKPIDRYVPNYTIRRLAENAGDPSEEMILPEAEIYFLKGKKASEEGNMEKAIESLLGALRISPCYEKAQGYLEFCLQRAPSKPQKSASLEEKEKYIEELLRLLEQPVIMNHSISRILGEEVEQLMEQEESELSIQSIERWKWTKKLLIDQKVSQFVANKLEKLSIDSASGTSSPGQNVVPISSLTTQVQQLHIQPTPQSVTPLSFQNPTPVAITPTAPSPKTPSSPSPKIQQQAQAQTTAQNPTPASWLPNIFQPTTQTPQVYSSPPVKPISKEVPLPSMAFGKAKWEKYFGDIGVEPPLPPNIEEILNSSCIFWSGKKVRDTHLLVLVPEKVNGRPFHLDSLAELIKSPKSGHKTEYRYYNSDVKKELGTKSLGSYWVLMTREVIPDSTHKSYEDQKALVQQYAQKSKIPYEFPKALEAATAILMHHVETGERLYPNIWTRCQEKVCNNQWPAAIGGFSSGGLSLRYYWLDDFYGLCACRKF
jgi:tetratricopeptide (TPR) repeat protein